MLQYVLPWLQYEFSCYSMYCRGCSPCPLPYRWWSVTVSLIDDPGDLPVDGTSVNANFGLGYDRQWARLSVILPNIHFVAVAGYRTSVKVGFRCGRRFKN